MNRRDDRQNSGQIGCDFLRLAGAVAGGTVAYIVTSNLGRLDSALACASAIACSSFANTRHSKPVLWWAYLGTIAGGIVGTASVLADSIAQSSLASEVAARCTVVGFLSTSGLISGICLGRNLHKVHIPTPREFLKGASALTTGIFAVVVTIKFILQGIDPARTLSSRLSTATTILVASLVVPGWIGYQLGRFRFR